MVQTPIITGVWINSKIEIGACQPNYSSTFQPLNKLKFVWSIWFLLVTCLPQGSFYNTTLFLIEIHVVGNKGIVWNDNKRSKVYECETIFISIDYCFISIVIFFLPNCTTKQLYWTSHNLLPIYFQVLQGLDFSHLDMKHILVQNHLYTTITCCHSCSSTLETQMLFPKTYMVW
jgi:hypothetical protein